MPDFEDADNPELMTSTEVLAELKISRGKLQHMEQREQITRVGMKDNHGKGGPSLLFARSDVDRIKYAIENNLPIPAADYSNVRVIILGKPLAAGKPPEGEVQRYWIELCEAESKREFLGLLPPWSTKEIDIARRYLVIGWHCIMTGKRGPGGRVGITQLALDMQCVVDYALSIQTRKQQGDS